MTAEIKKSELARVREALSETIFGDLVQPSSVESMVSRGLEEHLIPRELPVVRRGLDLATPPYYEVDPTLEDLEAEPDKERLAWALLENQVEATCDRTRALIESVADAGVAGVMAQGLLLPRLPQRKVYPWWYNPRRSKPAADLPCLFALFGEG